MKQFLTYTFLGLNILLVGVCVLGFLAPLYEPSENKYVPVFGVVFPYIFLLHLLFIIIWLFLNKKFALLSILTLIIGYKSLARTIHFGSSIYQQNDEALVVSSFNVARNSFVKEEDWKDYIKHISSIYNNQVFAIQEGTPALFKALKSKYTKASLLTYDRKSIGFLTHLPVLKHGLLSFGSTANACSWADLSFRGKTIRIYNAHLQSNTISQSVQQITSTTDFDDKKSWSKLGRMIQKYNHASTIRLEQVKVLKQHIAACPYPVIILGDMNDVPQSHVYHHLSTDLQDAFLKKGFGMGATFAGNIPALRIDYSFLDKHWDVLSYQTIRSVYSDHYAISVQCQIRDL